MEKQVVLLLISLPFYWICNAVEVRYKDCGSTKGKIESVDVDPCDNPSFCSLKKNTSPKISVSFIPNENVTSVKAVVHGIISGIPVPFPLPHPDGCTESGLTCPIAANTKVTYFQQLQIKSEYPNLVVVVKWELEDQTSKDLVCFEIRTKIVD